MPDRPKVGPADPETRRKKLREILDTPTGADGVAPKSPPAVPNSAKTMLEAVSDGVDQGTESDMLPNGQKRRVGAKRPKRDTVKRFGEKGQTEDVIMGDQ